MHIYNTVIIGAGASGLTAAEECGKNALIIDHNHAPGRKILVSGGGNCNFSNRSVTAADYVSSNPHFCKSALAGFTPADFLKRLSGHNVQWEEREQGRLFAFNAKHISDMLVRRAEDAGAEFLQNVKVSGIEKNGAVFDIKTSDKDYRAARVIVSSGGLSGAKLGASSFAFDVAAAHGLNIIPLYPALTPFLWREKEAEFFKGLSGVSCRAELTVGKLKIKDDLLFTHYGLSGPAALQASLYTKGAEEIKINFLPDLNAGNIISQARKTNKSFSQFVSAFLPQSLAKALFAEIDVQAANAAKEACDKAERILTAYSFTPKLNESYLKAEITAGGIDTREINSKTMECGKVPGLYFTGECLDVSGRLGGYNLHWAWASGFAAGRAIANKI